MKTEQVKRAYKVIERGVAHFLRGGSKLNELYEVSDLTQEVYTHFLEKKFFEKFDEKVTSFEYFIASATKNHLIDITRKRLHKTVSLDTPVKGKDGESTTLGSFFEEKLTDQFSAVLLKQMLERCPDTQVSPNYRLSWKELLMMIVNGMEPSEIHAKVGISSGRVCQLKTQLLSTLRESYL